MSISAEATETQKPEQIQRTITILKMKLSSQQFVEEALIIQSEMELYGRCMFSTQRLEIMLIHYTSNETLLINKQRPSWPFFYWKCKKGVYYYYYYFFS